MSTAKAAVESLLYALPSKVIKEIMIRNKEFEFKVYLHSIGMYFFYFLIRIHRKMV